MRAGGGGLGCPLGYLAPLLYGHKGTNKDARVRREEEGDTMLEVG